MNITLRAKIFIIGGLIIGFLLAIGLSLYLLKDKNKKSGNLFAPTQNIVNKKETAPPEEFSYKSNNNIGPQNKVFESAAFTTQTPDEIYVKQLAALFTERFNTYSNRNDNAHIEDALALSTAGMASWLNSQRIKQEGEYQGITVKVLASNIISLTKEKSRVTIGAEEIISRINASNTSKFRTGTVDLVKIEDEWKVSGFYWEE